MNGNIRFYSKHWSEVVKAAQVLPRQRPLCFFPLTCLNVAFGPGWKAGYPLQVVEESHHTTWAAERGLQGRTSVSRAEARAGHQCPELRPSEAGLTGLSKPTYASCLPLLTLFSF